MQCGPDTSSLTSSASSSSTTTGTAERASAASCSSSQIDRALLATWWWTPQDGRVATWLNRAWALGEEKVFTSAPFSQDEVACVAHAPRLAPANGKGICLVRPQVAAHYLDCAGPLLAEDAVHGAELKRP